MEPVDLIYISMADKPLIMGDDVFTDSSVLQDAAEAAKELLPELAFHEALNGRVKKNRNERLSL